MLNDRRERRRGRIPLFSFYEVTSERIKRLCRRALRVARNGHFTPSNNNEANIIDAFDGSPVALDCSDFQSSVSQGTRMS